MAVGVEDVEGGVDGRAFGARTQQKLQAGVAN